MYLIAKCRMGNTCRYHGRRVDSPALVRKARSVDYALVCPEMGIGMPCPRPPIRMIDGRAICGPVDVTEELEELCEHIAAKHSDVTALIGVKGSPTCDPQHGLLALALRRVGVPTRLSI